MMDIHREEGVCMSEELISPEESVSELSEEQRFIVVSDIHLGAVGAHCREFCDFLRWIKSFPTDPVKVQCKENGNIRSYEREISFAPLSRLILLGDIIDMWDPKDQNRTQIIAQSIHPFSILHDIQCDKIYVTGNHDEDIDEIATLKKNFPWRENYKFMIAPRHYPETQIQRTFGGERAVLLGQKINGIQYSFLHGHQFDGEQIQFTISKIVGTRFDPIDTLSDLANVSMSKTLKIRGELLITFLWFIFIIVAYFSTEFVKNSATAILLGAVALSLLSYYPKVPGVLSERIPGLLEHLIIEGIFLFPSLVLIIYIGILYLAPGLLPPTGILSTADYVHTNHLNRGYCFPPDYRTYPKRGIRLV